MVPCHLWCEREKWCSEVSPCFRIEKGAGQVYLCGMASYWLRPSTSKDFKVIFGSVSSRLSCGTGEPITESKQRKKDWGWRWVLRELLTLA